jgi:putative hydrolase of the HAD superfamily
MFKAVLFDLDDTLMPDESAADESIVAAAQVAKQWHNIPPGDLKDSVRRIARQLFRAHPVVAPYNGNFDVSSWSALSAGFDGEDDEMKQLSAWVSEYRHEVWSGALAENGIADPLLADTLSCVYMAERRARYQPFPDALQVLRELGQTFRLGLVTNGPCDLQCDKLDVSGLRGCFGAVVVSREVGIAKPDPRIFAIALDRLAVSAADSVFVGDTPKTDIVGAHAAGMKAIWLNRDNSPAQDGIVPDATIAALDELPAAIARLNVTL